MNNAFDKDNDLKKLILLLQVVISQGYVTLIDFTYRRYTITYFSSLQE